MTHVEISIRRDKDDEYAVTRKMDYKDKSEVCADVEGIMKFITDYME